MKTGLTAAAILLLAGTPAFAHRLDEYLQGTIISIEKNRVEATIALTPGVSVFAGLIADIDTDGNGVISAVEQRAYASRVLRDLTLKIDGEPLELQLLSMRFPAMEEMREGRGEIQIEFSANLPPGGPKRRLVFENYHKSLIAAYQVNCLVPRDPDIRILTQHRNYPQSFYEVEFEQAGVRSGALNLASVPGVLTPLGIVAIILVAWLMLLSRQRV
jgi:hypothetical protein